MPKKNYKWGVFKHWANLTFLGASVVAGVTIGWPVVALAALFEGAALWVLSDIPAVQRGLDVESNRGQFGERRRYYLRQLFDMEPPAPASGFLSLFMESKQGWVIDNARWSHTNTTRERNQYNRMINIVEELRTLLSIHPDRLSTVQITQIDEAINVWLSLHVTAKTLDETLKGMLKKDMEAEARKLVKLQAEAGDDRAAKLVIHQRLLNLKEKAEARPLLEQRKGLALAQAEKLVAQAETFLGTIKTAGGGDASALDFMVDRHQLLEGSFDNAAVQTEMYMLETDGQEALLSEVLSSLNLEPEPDKPMGELDRLRSSNLLEAVRRGRISIKDAQ